MKGIIDSVLSSTIITNTGNGFNIFGSNNIVNYNKIYKNAIGMNNNGTNTNANLNWWGVNIATTQFINSGSNLNLTTWYVIHLSANELNTTCNASRNCNINEMVNLTYILTTNDYSNHMLVYYLTLK